MDAIHAATASWVAFCLRHGPANRVLAVVTVWLATVVVIALAASVVRFLAAPAEFGARFRLRDRVDRWHGRLESNSNLPPVPISEETPERWAHRVPPGQSVVAGPHRR